MALLQSESASESIFEKAIQFRKRKKLSDFYPDYGPLARDKYAKHMEFFRAGASASAAACRRTAWGRPKVWEDTRPRCI